MDLRIVYYKMEQKVYAIDVGYGQLALELRQDERVVVMERVNARHLESLPENIDCIVADLSFISISKILQCYGLSNQVVWVFY